MAVFTEVAFTEGESWFAKHYDHLGRLKGLQGISSGIENSNFFIQVEDQSGQKTEYVLTLFERLTSEQLPFYLNLMEHLAKKDIKVPAPIRNRENQLLSQLKNKPATIVTKLKGSSKLKPEATHCALVGDMLARMHLAGMDFPMHQPNLRSLGWWQETVPTVLPYLQKQQQELLLSELKTQSDFFQSANYSLLPSGPSHCDLFRDNVLFDEVHGEDQLGGFFDFYFAGTDKWLFDLAVTTNDWCIDLTNGELQSDRYQALINSYQLVRPLSDAEMKAWPLMLRAAALRFWISRLWDFYLPRDAALLTPHDPTHFERVLIARRNQEFTV